MVLAYKAMNVMDDAVASLPFRIDPNVKPNSNAPFVKTIQDIAGIAMFVCVVLLVIAFAVGAVMWVYGKIMTNGRAQEVGVAVLMWTVIGAACVGSAPGLIKWGTGLDLGL